MNGDEVNEISTITRTAIFDALQLSGLSMHGRRDEVSFLARIFDLGALPSHDHRFRDMAGDIGQHRINNPEDWPDDWVLRDARLNLLQGPDDIFLNLLCEMVHPLVRPNLEDVWTLLAIFNPHLRVDGWEIAEETRISGKPIFAARKLVLDVAPVATAKALAQELNAEYLTQQINRMQSGIAKDPELAIGSAKEFIETICKAILKQRKITPATGMDFPALVRFTVKQLQLVPDHLAAKAGAAKTITTLLNNLASTGTALAELRNPYGTGHGKDISYQGLEEHHARLAVHVATAIGIFLFETHRKHP
jgi:hypothetical protein